ncbi:hypothetical protein [Nocardia nepalensis]|uniref:hypothetical protein n=1 Tax=Nocardia nepalensis TaxID=3375448 RepID=UPI003B6755D3
MISAEMIHGSPSIIGREGALLLQDQGTVADDIVGGEWFVVPESGLSATAGVPG